MKQVDSKTKQYHLFEGFGLEIDYLIVERNSLAVAPIADQLLRGLARVEESKRGGAEWSNRLALHQVALKTASPVEKLESLEDLFLKSVRTAGRLLEEDEAILLGTGMHPFMHPRSETKLWPHEGRAVYAALDRIFSCKRHAWANQQAVTVSLPFADDEEFGRLHAAVRLVLPIIPALAASSPLMENRLSGFCDSRLEAYRSGAMHLPIIGGDLIPEQAFTREEYETAILDPIRRELAQHDPERLLTAEGLNGRVAAAHFESGTVEIRAIDAQETPGADLAVAAAVVGAIRLCVAETFAPFEKQKRWATEPLKALFLETVKNGSAAVINDAEYLSSMGWKAGLCSGGQLWKHLVGRCHERHAASIAPFRETIERLLERGTLAEKITQLIGGRASWKGIDALYRQLGACLPVGTLF